MRVIPGKGGFPKMREYEVVVIADPELDETSFKSLVEKVSGWITEAGGSVLKTELWGKQRMAYLIKKQREGQYFMLHAQMAPAFTTSLERNLRLSEPVLRFMITVK
jgi:small subunit ribosomal protein S6